MTITAVGSTEPDADGLARPIDFSKKYGAGNKRGLVFGGGGVFFVAWQVAYVNGLMKRGVQLQQADVLVGTSAGSVVAAIVAFDALKRFEREIDLMARVPALIGMMAPAGNLHPSQLRALNMFRAATDSNPDTVRAIGHAALAADTPEPREMRRSVGFTIPHKRWPTPSLHISTTDAYTGERVVLTESAGISPVRAAAASSAVPGLFAPQPVGDRRCMDGGASGSGTHCDLVSGVEKAFVISLSTGLPNPVAGMTIAADNMEQELRQLAENGTTAFARGPLKVDLTKLMDPSAVNEARAMGEDQAASDAPELAAFWNR